MQDKLKCNGCENYFKELGKNNFCTVCIIRIVDAGLTTGEVLERLQSKK